LKLHVGNLCYIWQQCTVTEFHTDSVYILFLYYASGTLNYTYFFFSSVAKLILFSDRPVPSHVMPMNKSASSSSFGATARCGLWPVEQYLSIFPYLSPTHSIFSLPALEDLFLLIMFHAARVISLYLILFRSSSLNLSRLLLCSTFVTISFFYCVGLLAPCQTPNLEDQGILFCLGHHP